MNKCIELATESIPGCVLQLYAWLAFSEEAGRFALVSIGVSALTTGFISAMIAYDMDTSMHHRQNQPQFYGYIPDSITLRRRTLILMTSISSLHNLSRCIGCALLAVSVDKRLIAAIVGGEVAIFIVYKVAYTRDFRHWIPIEGNIQMMLSIFHRVMVSILTIFAGCLHLR